MRFERCGLKATDRSAFLGALEGASVDPEHSAPNPHPLLRHRGSAL